MPCHWLTEPDDCGGGDGSERRSTVRSSCPRVIAALPLTRTGSCEHAATATVAIPSTPATKCQWLLREMVEAVQTLESYRRDALVVRYHVHVAVPGEAVGGAEACTAPTHIIMMIVLARPSALSDSA